MTQQKIPSQWQLQDTGEPADQWMLREDEQRLPSHLQLQEQSTEPVFSDSNWQPIDYQAMQAAAARPRRGGIALTSLIVLALLGVGGYLTWFYLGQPGFAPAASPTEVAAPTAVVPGAETTPDGAVPMGDVPATEAPAVAAEPTPVPATPTPEPVLIEVRQATVDNQYGVNLRETALASGTLVRVLDNGTALLVVSGPTTDAAGSAWYELAGPDGTRGWASGDFIRIASQMLPYDQAAALYTQAGVTPPALPSANTVITATEGIAAASPMTSTTAATTTAAATATAPAAASQPVSTAQSLTVTASAAPASAAAPIRLTGVISAPAGLNLRREPVTGDNVIQMLEDATPLTVIGRSSDGQWLQVETADGRQGWLAAGFVNVTGDVNSIPLGTTQPVSGTATAPAAATATPTASTNTPAPATGVAGAGSLSTVTVTSVAGVNVRPEPRSDSTPLAQLDWSDTARATGRSADSQWVQVELETGTTGWVSATAVSVSGGLTLLPVVP